MLIFLLAGDDTTVIAFTFALHVLGQHPQWHERIRAADAEQLAYTTMVLKGFPFGGPRARVGQYFSMLEAAILLSVIVRDHELTSLTADEPLAPRITLHPGGPVASS